MRGLVAERLGSGGTLVGHSIAIPRPSNASTSSRPRSTAKPGYRADFTEALDLLRAEGAYADLVYLDLGISSIQLDALERGFSYTYDAPLDMRMDTDQELSAASLLNEWPERRLAEVIREHGEERHARADRGRDRPPPAPGHHR